MQVGELRAAMLRLGLLCERQGATEEGRALKELARVIEAHSDQSVASFVKKFKAGGGKRLAPQGRRR